MSITHSSPAVETPRIGTLPVYTATIFLSAFLLFSVQPMFSKMVLPVLGGSPGVWSVAMVFFQACLLAGYGYAHLLTKYLSLRTAGLVHLGVSALAFIFLPLALPEGWTPPNEGQALWQLGLMSVSVGLPFFAVAANSPLLQAWFARTGHPHAADPYFLYGASNVGSFASLILYVIAFEPTMTLPMQSLAWAVGFGILAFAIALCLLRAVSGTDDVADDAQVEANSQVREGAGGPLQWVALAFVPSGLLVAVTAHISTDIAAAPFLWIAPLALFLLTFVIAFSRRQWIGTKLLSGIVIVLAVGVLAQLIAFKAVPVVLALPLHLAFFFAAALLAHMVLVSLRPEAERLTGFYLWMSFGGVLGGAVTTLLSPLLFDIVIEYPMLVLATLLCRPAMWQKRDVSLFGASMPFQAVALAALMATFVLTQSLSAARGSLFIERSFFGVTRVFDSGDGIFRVMKHGSTYHGIMKREEAGKPTPLAYYHESGGIARSLFAVQDKLAGNGGSMGVVGLGAGSVLCHRRPGERWTSYEIDSVVVQAASDPALFRFVSECGEGDPIVLGDGRLTLREAADNSYDWLLIDAFSSDSIPVHLMTVEALDLYRSKLKEDGVLAIHISNRYIELRSVLAAAAKELGMTGRYGAFIAPGKVSETGVTASQVVVLANSEAALGSIADEAIWLPLGDVADAVWTDNFSNLPAAMLRGWRQSRSQ